MLFEIDLRPANSARTLLQPVASELSEVTNLCIIRESFLSTLVLFLKFYFGNRVTNYEIGII